jgi:cytochrome c oxidase subunit 3
VTQVAELAAERGAVGPRGATTRGLAMRLFLVSLGILFGACLIGYLVIRSRAEQWPPSGSPELPGGLWLSTAILVISSGLLMAAVSAARSGAASRLRGLLGAATVAGLAFLAVQVGNWVTIASAGYLPRQSLLTAGFIVLSFLHAAHVLGGLVPLAMTTLRAGSGRYTDDPEPIELTASYWHFLGATWIAIFLVLSI